MALYHCVATKDELLALPHLEAFAGDDPAAAFARLGHLHADDRRFDRGLQRLLDGLELWVNRAT